MARTPFSPVSKLALPHRPMAVHLMDIAVDHVRLGIYSAERRAPQPVVVHLRLRLDVSGVAKGDDIEMTEDYAALLGTVTAACQSRHFDLLESLVMAVAEALLTGHPRLAEADVEIEKIQAPVPARVSARWSAVRAN